MRTLLAALFFAVAAQAETPEAAYARIDKAKLSNEEARGRVTTVVRALNDAGMPRSATVLLAALASDDQQAESVRAAARSELAARAAGDPGLAQLLLAQEDGGKLPPALAVRIARGHLERALQLQPLEEGVAFDTIKQDGPAMQPASSEPQPLDKELAAEMGAPAQPGPQQEAPPPKDPQNDSKDAARELDKARALAASIPAGDASEGDAHEILGLAALATGDEDAAEKEFVALAELPVKRGDEAATARRDKAFLQLARLAYASGDDARATALYERVGRKGPEWLDALFEASWAHFRSGQDEKALGNLLTLHAPFFETRFFPESFVLKALVLYENCRYADARATLADFSQRYQPIHDGLAATLASLTTQQAAADFLVKGAVQLQQVSGPAGEEVARIEQDPDVLALSQAASQLAHEIDSLDKRPAVFRESALMTRVAPLARQARIALLETAGQKFISRVSLERGELRELLAQSLRLAYEIAGREKELAGDPAQGLKDTRHEPAHVQDDEELWPFDGEYWRDELGSYRYQLGRRCAKPRRPPQTATQRQDPPAAVAGDPESR